MQQLQQAVPGPPAAQIPEGLETHYSTQSWLIIVCNNCNRRYQDRLQPRFLKDLKNGDVSVFDVLDFIFNSVSKPRLFRCIAEVSGNTSKAELSRLQQEPDDNDNEL